MRTDGPTDGHTYLHTDRHDEANSRFSQSCERARKGAGSVSLGFADTQHI